MGVSWREQDAAILRRWEEERLSLTGPLAEYYSLERGEHVDPVYNEPTSDPLDGGPTYGSEAKHTDAFKYLGPKPLRIALTFTPAENVSISADEAGLLVQGDGEAHVARNEWERAFPGRFPKEGDVMFANNFFFDITAVNPGGDVLDTRHYVGFRFAIKFTSRFTPDRKPNA